MGSAKTYRVEFKGVSPYSQSKHHETPKLDKEGASEYEARTWRERMHANSKGDVFIPPMAFKVAIAEAAKYLQLQIPGKGKSTYTKHFEAGVMVVEPVYLGVKKDDVRPEALFVPSDGVRGSGKRVTRIFGCIEDWGGSFDVVVVDPIITKPVLAQVLAEAGSLIGIGRFRPRNNGYYGRFDVLSLKEVA